MKTNDHFEDVNLEVMPIIEPGSAVRHFVVLFEKAAGPKEIVPPPAQPLTAADESEKDREIGRLQQDLTFDQSFSAIGDHPKGGRQ